jgi:hypothetical protein
VIERIGEGKMGRLWFLVVVLTCAAVSSADARSIRREKLNNWDIGVYVSDSTNRFTHCASSAKYKSGITLLFSVNRNIEWAIGFSDPNWGLTSGKSYTVVYKIDSGPVHSGQGRAISPVLVRISLPDSVGRFNEFRHGDMLAVTAGSKVVRFRLTDTSPMLTALLRCAKQYRDRDRGSSRGNNLFN